MKLKNYKQLENLLENTPKHVSELHYDVLYELDNNIFLMKDGSLGVFYKLEGLYDETITGQNLSLINKSIANSLQGLMEDYDYVAQVINRSRKTTRKIKGVELHGETCFSRLINEENEKIEQAGYLMRDCYLSLRFNIFKTDTILEKFFNLLLGVQKDNTTETYLGEIEKLIKKLISFENQMYSTMKLSRVDNSILISVTQNALNGGISTNVYPTKSEIYKNIFSPPVVKDEKNNCLIIDDRKVGVFHFNTYPSSLTHGRIRHFLDELCFSDYDYIWTISHPNHEFKHNGLKNFYPDKVAAFKKISSDITAYENSVSRSNYEVVVTSRLIVYNYDESKEGRIIDSGNKNLLAKVQIEKQLPFFGLITSLPLNCSKESNKKNGIFKYMTMNNAIKLMSAFRGPALNHGLINRVSRYGTITRFNRFLGEGNRICATLGTSGAGKSSLQNDDFIEFSELFPNGIIRTLDIKTSYEKTCDILGGRVVRFSEADLRKESFSPFMLGLNYDDDDVELVFNLIKSIILLNNHNCDFTSLHDELLLNSLRIAYNKSALNVQHSTGDEVQCHPIWSDVAASLPETQQVFEEDNIKGVKEAVEDISKWTISLMSSGKYGYLFNRYEKINIKEEKNYHPDKMIVYDLDGIIDPTLKYIAACLAFNKTAMDFKKLPLTTVKLFAVDEFGVFCLKEKNIENVASNMITIMVKTLRKLNVVMDFLTNTVEDFTESGAGKTVWNLAKTKRFLPLGEAMYNTAREAWPNQFNEAEWQIIRSLKKEHEFKRSSVYIQVDNDIISYRGSYYNLLTPLKDAITSSSPKQVEYYRKRKAEMISQNNWEPFLLIKEMATNIPFGNTVN